MRTRNALPLAALLFAAAPFTTARSATPDPANTRIYIERTWSTLTRSMDECASLVG